VIGAGNVGATCAFVLAQMNVGEIVMLDIYEGVAKGKALDMSQGGQILNYDGKITGTKDYIDIADADVVVVTSGFPRQPGMSREDLIGKNADIISEVGAGIKGHAPDSVIVMVTNPLDLMTYHMQRVTGFPHHRVVGQAGILDSARMTHFVAQELGCSNEDVQAMVLGGHGDTMVPLPRYTTRPSAAATTGLLFLPEIAIPLRPWLALEKVSTTWPPAGHRQLTGPTVEPAEAVSDGLEAGGVCGLAGSGLLTGWR